MTEKEFDLEVKKLGINLTDQQKHQLNTYYELLINWNQKFNLTNITDKKMCYLKHFYDSLTINKIVDLNSIETLCDIGTGAGFPGLVLKIVFPNLKVTLIDSLNKRITFLNEVITKLKLDNVTTIHSRVEEYALENKEKYDLVTARALASMNVLLEYAIPLVKVNGLFVAMKGSTEEDISNCLKELDCHVSKVIKFLLPFENSNRMLVKVIKDKKTPKKYPRKYSEIKKKPL